VVPVNSLNVVTLCRVLDGIQISIEAGLAPCEKLETGRVVCGLHSFENRGKGGAVGSGWVADRSAGKILDDEIAGVAPGLVPLQWTSNVPCWARFQAR